METARDMEPALTSDPQLIRRMLAGDERAFESFFNAYFPRLYRFALPRLNGDVDATREIVQVALGKAIRKLESFRGELGLFTWICQICRHQIADYVRANRRRHQHVVSIDDSPEVRAALESRRLQASLPQGRVQEGVKGEPVPGVVLHDGHSGAIRCCNGGNRK